MCSALLAKVLLSMMFMCYRFDLNCPITNSRSSGGCNYPFYYFVCPRLSQLIRPALPRSVSYFL